MERIGDYAFENCSGLTDVAIGEGVESIGIYAFEYCNRLTVVTIPDSVTNIGHHAFTECNWLELAMVPEGDGLSSGGTNGSDMQRYVDMV